jgi:hypothetical protein
MHPNALLLLAVLVLAPVCFDLAIPPASAAPVAATAAAHGCCDTGSGPACADAMAAAIDACARHCARQDDASQTRAGPPPPARLASHGPAFTTSGAFPPHHSRLRAAPRASGNTRLIYQFQRLLN